MQTRRIAMIVAVVAALTLLLAASSTVAGPPVPGGKGSGSITLAGTVGAKDPDSQAELGAQAALGSAFTYQGQLNQGGTPVTGTCDFQFSLWEAGSGGAQVGATQSVNNVSMNNGLFTVPLDFGNGAFQGDARWLEIAVRCPAGSGSYTTLSPRQALTAAPYALHATSTGALRGRSVADIAPAAGQVLKWDGSVWAPAADEVGVGGAGDITAVYAGTGLTGGGESGDVTLHVDTAAIQRRVSGTCASGNAIRVINADGTVTCESVTGGPGAHDHWGEMWESDSGVGLRLQNAGILLTTDVQLGALAGPAINSYSMSNAGVRGASTVNDGVVGEASASDKSGVYGKNTGGGYGVYGWSSDGHGVGAYSLNSHSLYIPGSGASGVYVASAGTHGVDVASANGSGVKVYSAGKNGVEVDSANWSGVYVASAGSDAIRVQTAGQDGLRIFDTVGRDYIRAGSDADPDFRVQKDGLVLSDRGYRCGDGAPFCLQTGNADLAERVNASEKLAAGDVVEIDPTRPDHFRLARTPYSTLVAGVISTDPAIVMGTQGITMTGDGEEDERPPLALVGRVQVKVSAENGPIRPGDLLVTSSTPGHAMRADNPPPGTILGKALEPLDAGTGVILVLVTLQ